MPVKIKIRIIIGAAVIVILFIAGMIYKTANAPVTAQSEIKE